MKRLTSIQRHPRVITVLISVLLASVVFACGPASGAHLSHGYDRARVATTGSAAVSVRSVRIYDSAIGLSDQDAIVAFGRVATEDASPLLRHYTTDEGAKGIQATGRIRPSADDG